MQPVHRFADSQRGLMAARILAVALTRRARDLLYEARGRRAVAPAGREGMMVLRNRLNRILHDRGLAEGEVATVARLDQGHLNRIKNGRVNPTLITALRIAHALGTPVSQLFYLEDESAPCPGCGDAPPVEAVVERPGPARALPADGRARRELLAARG